MTEENVLCAGSHLSTVVFIEHMVPWQFGILMETIN